MQTNKKDENKKFTETENDPIQTDESSINKIFKAIKGFVKAIPDLFRRVFKPKNKENGDYGKSIDTEDNPNQADDNKGKLLIIFETIKKTVKALPETFKRLFDMTREGIDSLGTQTNAFSVISIIVLAVAFLMNLTGLTAFINNLSSSLISLLGECLGLNISDLIADWMDNTSYNLFTLIFWVFQACLFLLCLLLDIAVNILGIILIVVLFVLQLAVTIIYAFLLPIGMVALGVIGLREDNSITNIGILILDVCLGVLFYIAI